MFDDFTTFQKIFGSLTLVGGFGFFALQGALILISREAVAEKFMVSNFGLSKKNLLTDNEQHFAETLRWAAEQLGVCINSQVAMRALFDVNLPEEHPYFHQVVKATHGKIVDFVVTSKDGKTLFVVELDDKTHDDKKLADATRDLILSKAGIPTVRFDSRAKPGKEALLHAFKQQLSSLS